MSLQVSFREGGSWCRVGFSILALLHGEVDGDSSYGTGQELNDSFYGFLEKM